MCGFVVLFGENVKDKIGACLQRIGHRGPDASQVNHYKGFSVGFNRLAINDSTASGMQPFKYKSLRCMVNGEVFNDEELKGADRLLFNSLNSGSDCAVVAPLFDKYGGYAAALLDGFFSGVVWDVNARKFFTLRDRVRKKPLFFGRSSEGYFLTSELKALNNIYDFDEVPAGCCELDLSGMKLTNCYQYSEFEHLHKKGLLPNQLKRYIDDAVSKRIPKNRLPFAVFLSGGLDSSIIASVVHRYRGNNVVYVSLAKEGSEDIIFVKQLEKDLGLKRVVYLKVLTGDIERLVEQVVYTTDSFNPSIISNGIGTYMVAAYVHKQGMKVALSGEGADELFGGYFSTPDDMREKQKRLMSDMHFTELRRVDLCGMAHAVEIRCPFLDEKIQSLSKQGDVSNFYQKKGSHWVNKSILREAFKNILPKSIIERKKVSFDVGSGIREVVVSYLNRKFPNMSERDALKQIWEEQVGYPQLSEKHYFSCYPTFDTVIDRRGHSHSG